jgi:hypothetical protein
MPDIDGGALMFRCLLLLSILLAGVSSAPAQPNTAEAMTDAASEAYHSGDLRKAQSLAAKALEIAGRDDMSAINPLATLAAASAKLKDYAAAERHYRALLATMERLFGRDSINAAFGMEALARVLLKRGMVDDAEALVMIVQGEDAFGLRHDSMRSHLALARSDWRTAYEGFHRVIERLGRDGPVDTPDHLEGLASETNIATFIGLTRAAWKLRGVPGYDAGALVDATFKDVQWRWRTEAGEALLLASERTGAASAAQATVVRQQQDQDEQLKKLMAEAEALQQAWFSKREQNPAYGTLWKRQMAANMAAATDDLPKAMQEYVEVGTRLVEVGRQCMSRPTPQCAGQIAELQAKEAALKQKMAQAAPVDYSHQLCRV